MGFRRINVRGDINQGILGITKLNMQKKPKCRELAGEEKLNKHGDS